jgi:hypothetical protein
MTNTITNPFTAGSRKALTFAALRRANGAKLSTLRANCGWDPTPLNTYRMTQLAKAAGGKLVKLNGDGADAVFRIVPKATKVAQRAA